MRVSLIRPIFALALTCAVLPASGVAQNANAQTLADLRQDMSVLYVEVQRLKRELSTTGSTTLNLSGDSALDRLTSIEGELQRLTGKIEELEFRIDSIVKDGTNRLGDLEFRLVELEGGDISQLGETSTLGGGAAPVVASVPTAQPETTGGGAQLAVGEQADFDAASKALQEGDAALAAEQFATFTQNYPGSPLEGQARLKQGEALEAAGDTREAARAYLEAYSRDPSSAVAPDALFRLGRALGRLGKVSEACVTLGEVSARHAGSAADAQAQAEMAALSCS